LRLSPGNGDQRLPRWFYDPTARSCETFTYTGVGGNENNFGTRQDCVNVCVSRDGRSSVDELIKWQTNDNFSPDEKRNSISDT
jgi:hypothetical protein